MRPILRKTLNRNRWWALFNTAANFAYDLSNGRYMRSGGASTQALSLTETRASSAMALQSNGTYVERAAGELAVGQGVGLQVSEAVTNRVEYSDDFSQWWVHGNLTYTQNDIQSPFAGRMADKFVSAIGAANSGTHRTYDTGVALADNSFTVAFMIYSEVAFSGVIRMRGSGVTQEAENLPVEIPVGWSRVPVTKTFTSAASGTYLYLGLIPDFGASPGRTWWQSNADVVLGETLYPPIICEGSFTTRAADNPVVVQGVGGVPWEGYDLATGITFQQVFSPSDTGGIEAFTFSDGTSDNYLIVRRGAGGGVEIEAYLAGVLTFSAESSTAFPTNLAAIELYMKQGATVTVALDGVILSDITQAGKTLANYSQVSLGCGAGTSTIKEVYGK